MRFFLSLISDITVIAAILIVLVILVIWLLIHHFRVNGFRKDLAEMEERYNTIKSKPLTMKMNRAVALSRVDQETGNRVAEAKRTFDKAQAEISKIASRLADADEEVNAGKLGAADRIMTELETDLTLAENDCKALEESLDAILSRETAHRTEVTALKNRFRELKEQAQADSGKLSYSWNLIEKKISETEKQFSAFEEWMFSNDYDNANRELGNIKESLASLEGMLNEMPALLEDARGIIPKMAENLHRDYVKNRNRGVYLRHLDVDKNLQVMTTSLREDLKALKQGTPDGVREHLEDYKKRLQQMDEQVQKESEAFNQIAQYKEDIDKMLKEATRTAAVVDDIYQKNQAKLGLSSLSREIEKQAEELKSAAAEYPAIQELAESDNAIASDVVGRMTEFNNRLVFCNQSLREIKERIEVAAGDEDRIRKQLVKLQIIMNQMQVKIRKYKLPSISEHYDQDMKKAREYIKTMDDMMKESPLNMQVLISLQQEALDFIYKLYNNVNNVVGTVVMVENTIVFGNRYRSTYADIDSELTRSELCFRNGEYTQALTIAIATIEKIHPGNYEMMIKENAKGAE